MVSAKGLSIFWIMRIDKKGMINVKVINCNTSVKVTERILPKEE
ncbi:hypothetical protein [Candidatus Cardinium hertigii]|nr:hypothetical protein [Candidatus Cardinium hertigii]